MRKALFVALCLCFGVFMVACGPKAPATEETTPEGEAGMTEAEDVEDVEVEETTEETEEEDEELAPEG